MSNIALRQGLLHLSRGAGNLAKFGPCQGKMKVNTHTEKWVKDTLSLYV
jgi:hypothetical protein